tara:strand:+ start:244 stop:447 length:204 start_codon:yes stop_codon:yes gene_type:complete
MSDIEKGTEQRLKGIEDRLQAIEEFLRTVPTPDKLYYRPEGCDEYLDVKGNYDEIYKRIKELKENGM